MALACHAPSPRGAKVPSLIGQIADDLRRHEGTVLHAYPDHLGYWTIGVGRMIDERRGGGISEAEAEHLLANDIDRIAARLQHEAGFRNSPSEVKRALVNMAFQMGIKGLLGFTNMWRALEQHDYETAATEALDSKWANQTPTRANEVADWIRSAA